MITSQHYYFIFIHAFVQKQQTNCFNTVIATIHIITKKNITFLLALFDIWY
jgi:hypothetical protein